MANITENSIWESGIYQLETDDPTLGGPPGFNAGVPVVGHANAQAQQLANRTKYLKDVYIPQKIDEHNSDASAHPELSAFITSEADRAQTAADSSAVNGNIFENTTDGLTATVDGEYFSTPSAETDEYLILYQNQLGVAQEVKKYPSYQAIVDLKENFPESSPIGYAFSVIDSFGKASFAVKDDGTFVSDTVEVNSFTSNSVDIVNSSTLEGTEYPDIQFAISDEAGKVAFSIKDDGEILIDSGTVKNLTVEKINDFPYVSNALSRLGGVYSHSINFINNTGQSLGEGSTPAVAITTVQEYDNVGFPARSTSPTSFVPLTVVNTQVGSRGESPMYGTLGNIKELIEKENGISYLNNDYQLVSCNNAYSGYSITQLNKGTLPYTRAISQVQSAYDISTSSGKTMSCQATTWTQGEADAGMPKDTYKQHLKQLAIDYNSDIKAITNQFNNSYLITYQCATANRNIALAQLECSNESSLIYMACPMYQFDYGDNQHITAESSKWLGGYYGLVYKRVVIDRQEWQPLQPVSHSINGNTVDLVFNKTGLVLDTDNVPLQVDYGFQVLDAVSAPVPISSISVIGPNRVRLTLSNNPAPSWTIRYGFNSAVNKTPFVGGCGNLRDNQGDTVVYSSVNKPMHNWCVIFSYSI